WTVADYRNICAATGCTDVMLGRGAVADPLLARRIRDGEEYATDADWAEISGMLAEFWARVQAKLPPHQSPGRLKQWLGMMQRSYPQAEVLYGQIREARKAPEISLVLDRFGMRPTHVRPRDASQPVAP
ncbi:MAG: hypothetical protein WC493_22670, partial [Zavarzinia sp.]